MNLATFEDHDQMKAVFCGCSFTKGEGFPEDQRDQYIYDRLVSAHFGFERTNLSAGGSSNYRILLQAAAALTNQAVDILFVQWSALNRLWLSPGPETYFFLNDEKYPDFKYRNIYISPKEFSNIKNTLQILNHDYQNIFDLVDYCCMIELMAQTTKTQVVYINGLVPWKPDLLTPLGPDLSQSLSDYTKNILDFNNRSDEEIIDYFTKLQQKFSNLDQNRWVNLFDGFYNNAVDLGPEGHHPGVASHEWMAEQIINFLTDKIML